MNKINSKCLSGDLNYLVTEYLQNSDLLPESELDTLVNKIKNHFNYGTIYDIDMNELQCNYELRKELFTRLENKTLQDMVIPTAITAMSEIKMQGSIDEEKKQPNTFNMMRNSKINAPNSSRSFPIVDRIQAKSFKHMRSILGHISVIENNIINPVPIYCVTYSTDNQLIFTGDNNGLIKIWSSKTGALVDIFKSHDKPINDLLIVENYLISCSDDKTLIIWDTRRLLKVKELHYDESFIRILSYDYFNTKTQTTHKIIITSSSSGKIFLYELDNINSNNDSYSSECLMTKLYFDKRIIEKFNLILKRTKNNFQQSCMCADPTTGILVCGYNDGLMCVWDMERILNLVVTERRFLHEFEKYVLFLDYPHSSIVHISEFNKTGTNFISASLDGNVLIWRVNTNVIANFRIGANNNFTSPFYEYPIYSMYKICETDKVTKCSVNAAAWSCNNNYVITVISSKLRKKGITEQEQQNDNSKRSSALLIYDIHSDLLRRFDKDNGFNFHDQCFVLEAHPQIEELVLTVIGTNEIILLNFLSGEVVNKFIIENIFFNNTNSSIVASEGKFSSKGDEFVITSFLGFISLYSIYSDNSYKSTYMNQFLDTEFRTRQEIDETLFPSYVNMYNLPYIIQQPYSKYKLSQIEEFRPRLINNYNYSQTEIDRRMPNNNYYDKNLLDRIIECDNEENALLSAAKENLAYEIPDQNDLDDSSLDEVNNDMNDNDADDFSEYNSNDEMSEGLGDLMEEEEKLSQNEIEDVTRNAGVYHLRSRRNNARNSRRTRRLGTNRQHNSARNRTNQSTNREGRQLRRLRSNSNDNPQENHNSLRRRLRTRRQLQDLNSQEETPSPQNDLNEIVQEFDKQFNDDVAELIKKCETIEDMCFLCKFFGKNLIGPFKTDDFINFTLDSSLQSSRIIEDDVFQPKYEKFYFHTDCLIFFNDFIQTDHSIFKRLDISATIKETIRQAKICWRCDSVNATKKCSNESCDRYFHGNTCLAKYCVVRENPICLECYKEDFIKNKRASISTTPSNVYKNLSRSFFTQSTPNVFSFYPQVGSKVYFLLQPYEDYLRNNFESIIYEVEETFFWRNENTNFPYTRPFLCEVIDFQFIFPSTNTTSLLKQLFKKEWQNFVKITAKIQLRIIELNKIIQIIFMENDQADFLIDSELYLNNLQIYAKLQKEMTKSLGNNNKLLKIVIGNDQYDFLCNKIEDKEHNEKYKDSQFENIIGQYITNQPMSNNETVRVSFWDILDESMGVLQRKSYGNVLNKLNPILLKSSYSVFMNMVDEDRDGAVDYYNIIEVPMYIKLIIERIRNNFYSSIDSILYDFNLIKVNSIKYNGENSSITRIAKSLCNEVQTEIKRHEQEGITNEILGRKRTRASRNQNLEETHDVDMICLSTKQRCTRSSYNSNKPPSQLTSSTKFSKDENSDSNLDKDESVTDQNQPSLVQGYTLRRRKIK